MTSPFQQVLSGAIARLVGHYPRTHGTREVIDYIRARRVRAYTPSLAASLMRAIDVVSQSMRSQP